MRHLALLLLVTATASGADLRARIAEIAAEAQGKVSVACSLPGSPLNCDFNPRVHPPMQSVFKLPLGVTVLHLVEQGKFGLDQTIQFTPADRIPPPVYSPLQDKYPNATVDVPLRELLRLAVSLSDNVAADMLLRLVGGPWVVEAYVKSLGVPGFRLQDGEAAMHRDNSLQYRNWWTPEGAVKFLRRLNDRSPLTPEHRELLFGWMREAPGGAARLKGELPKGTDVAHKTGTSGTHEGVTAAVNDIGLIALPDGRRLAIAVFVTDTHADEVSRDNIIARIARAAWDEVSGGTAGSAPRVYPAR